MGNMHWNLKPTTTSSVSQRWSKNYTDMIMHHIANRKKLKHTSI